MGALVKASLAKACLQLAAIATAIKLLLVPTYRSTDFEVHRNWLAITHSLPISKWYIEATSEWTLDYPPLFAWFEWALSHVARLVDPAMLVVSNLEYASAGTILFQRGSVMATDLLLLAAAYVLARGLAGPDSGGEGSGGREGGGVGAAAGARGDAGGVAASRQRRARWRLDAGVLLFFLLSCNAGLLLVDHVHFQYNGALMGVLLWSLHAARTGRHLLSGVLFAALLNLKHLFLYAAPAYFVYLLRHYCLAAGDAPANGAVAGGSPPPPAAAADAAPAAAAAAPAAAGRKVEPGRSARGGQSAAGGSWAAAAAGRLALLGGGVVAVFAVSFGPFVAMGQTQQVLRRLFPFGRGLLHAYWAANAWAPYAAADKLAAAALPRLLPLLSRGLRRDMALLGLAARREAANMADGRVGISRFAVLPQVTPAATAVAVLAALLPCLAALWAGDGRPHYIRRTLARVLSYSFLCGFVFGYHVHEKAVLVALLPLAVDAVACRTAARRFLLLAAAGHYGLLPLLWRPQEYGAKVLLVLSYFVVAAAALGALHASGSGSDGADDGDGGSEGGVDAVAKGSGWQRKERVVARARPLLGAVSRLYVAGFVALELYCSVVHPYLVPGLAARLPFVPLMATSVYCSLGVLAVWVDMAVQWMREAAAALRRGVRR